MFKLKDLSGIEKNGWYYRKNLLPLNRPNLTDKKIVRQKRGKVQIEKENGELSSWINIHDLFIPRRNE